MVFLKLPPHNTLSFTLLVAMINSFHEALGYSSRLLYFDFLNDHSLSQLLSYFLLFLPTLAQLFLHHWLRRTVIGPGYISVSFLCPQSALYTCNHSFSMSFLPNTELPLILMIINTLKVLLNVSMAQRTQLMSNIFQCFPQSHITFQQRRQWAMYRTVPKIAEKKKKRQLEKNNNKNYNTSSSIKQVVKSS